jgi:archaellum biogenesis ATPase FlaH
MELVYLWVEENDSIKGTDFNFGSKYIFSFKKEKNENKGTLSIKDNPNFIENFYGGKISISAIAGKNATGKSQLLKLIWNGAIKDKLYFAIFKSKDSSNLIAIKNKNLEIPIKKLNINLAS